MIITSGFEKNVKIHYWKKELNNRFPEILSHGTSCLTFFSLPILYFYHFCSSSTVPVPSFYRIIIYSIYSEIYSEKLFFFSPLLPHLHHPAQTYLQRIAPHLPRSHSPSLHRIATTTKRICWQTLRNQTSPVDTCLGLKENKHRREDKERKRKIDNRWGKNEEKEKRGGKRQREKGQSVNETVW